MPTVVNVSNLIWARDICYRDNFTITRLLGLGDYSTRVYPKVSGLAARSVNCKRNSSLPLGAVVSLFCNQSSEFCYHKPLCCFSTSACCCCCCCCYFVIDSVRKVLDTPSHTFTELIKLHWHKCQKVVFRCI
jgi:hypothetical protein